MATHGFRQEMPPTGGYGGIIYERIPLKKPWSGVKLFSAGAASLVLGCLMYQQSRKRYSRIRRENDDVLVALEPLFVAERDRMYLDHLRKNREEETELMKNVPGWKTGTLYGEPLYKTLGDKMINPVILEYYAHTDQKHMFYHWHYSIFF